MKTFKKLSMRFLIMLLIFSMLAGNFTFVASAAGENIPGELMPNGKIIIDGKTYKLMYLTSDYKGLPANTVYCEYNGEIVTDKTILEKIYNVECALYHRFLQKESLGEEVASVNELLNIAENIADVINSKCIGQSLLGFIEFSIKAIILGEIDLKGLLESGAVKEAVGFLGACAAVAKLVEELVEINEVINSLTASIGEFANNQNSAGIKYSEVVALRNRYIDAYQILATIEVIFNDMAETYSTQAGYNGISTESILSHMLDKAEDDTKNFVKKTLSNDMLDIITNSIETYNDVSKLINDIESISSTAVEIDDAKNKVYLFSDPYLTDNDIKIMHTFEEFYNDSCVLAGENPEVSIPSTSFLVGTYKIVASIGLRLRQTASTSSSVLAAIPCNTSVSVTEISGNWGKTTYSGKTGWICLQQDNSVYAKFVSSSTNNSTVTEDTYSSIADITSHMKNVYKSALSKYSSSSFNGYCGDCVAYQLWTLGINSSKLTSNGNGAYDLYANKQKTSGGWLVNKYPVSSYSLKECLNVLNSQAANKYTYAILGFEKGSSSSAGQKYGHTLLIYAVVDGYVYYTECFNIGSTGSPYGKKTIAEFCTAYSDNSSTTAKEYVFEGMIRFSGSEIVTPDFYDITLDTYYIRNKSGAYLNPTAQSNDDNDIPLSTSTTKTDKMKFEVKKQDGKDDQYSLKSSFNNTDNRLNIWGDSAISGLNVGIYPHSGHSTQTWKFIKSGEYYAIIPVGNTSLALTLSNGKTKLSAYTGADSQLFKLESAEAVEDTNTEYTLNMSYTPSSAYATSVYYDNLRKIQLTGNAVTDLINVALSQVGYHNGNKLSDLDGSNKTSTANYTEYGYWYGHHVLNKNEGHFYAWCAMFISWCARQAQIPISIISNSAYAGANETAHHFNNLAYTSRNNATPKVGDLVFFGDFDHVGIVYEVTSSNIKTIEGNSDGEVKINTYPKTSTYIKGYGRPNYEPKSFVTITLDTYYIQNKSGAYLNPTAQSNDDNDIPLSTSTTKRDKMKFEVKKQDGKDDQYSLKSSFNNTDNRLNIWGESATSGLNVGIYPHSGHSTQTWKFIKSGEYYAMIPVGNTSLALTLSNGKTKLSAYTGADSQLFKFEHANHAYGSWQYLDDATHKKTCACGDVQTASHTWNSGVVTTQATHLVAEVKTHTCNDCNATKTVTGNKLPTHTYGAWETYDTVSHRKVCECGEEIKENHTWDNGVIENGKKKFTCTICLQTKYDGIHPEGEHLFGEIEQHDATEHKQTCLCGEVKYTAHTWNSGVVTTQATHTTTGVKSYTCTACNATKTETIAKLSGHTYGSWQRVDDTTHKKTCACGDVQTASHTWNRGVVSGSVKTFTCTDCNATKTQIIATADLATITVGSVKSAKDTTVNVPVVIKNNPGIAMMALTVDYDSSVLTLEGVTDGGILGISMHSPDYENDPYTLYWSNPTATENFTSNGTIATLSFKLKSGAELGKYPITISYDYDSEDIINKDFERIELLTVGGEVEVIDFTYGDVDGDGAVTNKDSAMIARYLARWNGYNANTMNLNAADVDKDGAVTNKDSAIIARHLARWNGYGTLPMVEKKGDIVVDYINETAPVSVSNSILLNMLPEGTKHKVVIPKINSQSSGAIELNEKMYSRCENYYKIVQNGTQDIIVDVSYEYRYANDVVGICLKTNYGYIASGWTDAMCFYYYDVKNDCEITYQEYLEKLGLSDADVWNAFKQSEEYQSNKDDLGTTIYDCIADKSSFIVSCESSGYSNKMNFTVEANLLK